MAQVMNPNVKKDDTIDTLVTGLNMAAQYQNLTKKNPSSMTSSISAQTTPGYVDAMQRRLDSMNAQYADSFDKGSS